MKSHHTRLLSISGFILGCVNALKFVAVPTFEEIPTARYGLWGVENFVQFSTLGVGFRAHKTPPSCSIGFSYGVVTGVKIHISPRLLYGHFRPMTIELKKEIKTVTLICGCPK